MQLKKTTNLNLMILSRIKRIKLVCLDFDGVLTDGFVYVDENGKETVRCSRKDSLGIKLMQNKRVRVVVVSRENNPVVSKRCKKLEVLCFQGIDKENEKLIVVKKISKEMKLEMSQVAFMGDDLSDLGIMKAVGLAVTVADGHKELKKIAHFVTSAAGGNHAVLEFGEKFF